MFRTLVFVAIGGGLGSVFRYLVSFYTNRFFTQGFPYATFIVNVVGCFLIGVLFGIFEKKTELNPNLSLLFITGFCGGFTTFSTFSFENMNLLNTHQYSLFALYTTLSIVFGLFAVFLGDYLVKSF
ncbi:MAG: fluoride efflux transporter CrcB [Flavobacteriales bacterium]|nr:fluoride efflux transporter CrcB [Flavobacteriales bacterium]